MIFATHEMSSPARSRTRCASCTEGAILERGAPAAIFDAPRAPETQRFLERVR